MKAIPIKAGKEIAERYGYDQVVIVARKVGEGEHVTTYGVNKVHCETAARIGNHFKKVMNWPPRDKTCPHGYSQDVRCARCGE